MCDCQNKDLSPTERGLIHRRDFLTQASAGLGAIALTAMLAEDGLLPTVFADGAPPDPLAPKAPHLPPRAKSVIWLFMEGGHPRGPRAAGAAASGARRRSRGSGRAEPGRGGRAGDGQGGELVPFQLFAPSLARVSMLRPNSNLRDHRRSIKLERH